MTQKALRVSIYIYIVYIIYILYILHIYIYIILWTLYIYIYIYIYIEYKDQHSKSFYQGVSTTNLTNNRKLNQILDIFILLF